MEHNKGRINQQTIKLDKSQLIYSKQLLKRIAMTLKYLCSKGLPLKLNCSHYSSFSYITSDDDDDDDDDVNDNNGLRHKSSLISHIQFVAAYNPFIQKHIAGFSKDKGDTSVLSLNTYKEFVKLIEKNVYNSIFEEIKTAKYYSIIIDYAYVFPFKWSLIFRYVQLNGKPVERFLCFLQKTIKPEQLENEIFYILKTNNLDIKNCRGLGYDHSSYMSKKYLALQTKIKESCTYAVYVPYSAYCLNLIGECIDDNPIVYNCFFYIKDLFNFFSDSQSCQHWRTLVEYSTENFPANIMFKKRWSNDDDACYSLSHYWKEIINVLHKFASEELEDYSQSIFNSKYILNHLNTLEMCIIVSVWSDVLEKLNETNNNLQDLSINISTIVSLYNSLIQYISDLRNKYDHYEAICIEKSGINEYSKQGQKRKFEEDELKCNSKEVFKIQIFIPTMNSLISELNKRKFAYTEINNKFGFFFHLIEMEPFEIINKATSLQKYYPDDLSVKYFPKECVQLRKVLLNLSTIYAPKTILEMYQKLQKIGVQEVFPEINTAFRMFLCSPATNFSSKKFTDDDNNHDNDNSDDEDDFDIYVDDNDDDCVNYDYDDDNIHVEDEAYIHFDGEDFYNDNSIHFADNNFPHKDTMYMNALEKIKKYQKCRNQYGRPLHYQPSLYTESDLTNNLRYDDITEQFRRYLVEKYK